MIIRLIEFLIFAWLLGFQSIFPNIASAWTWPATRRRSKLIGLRSRSHHDIPHDPYYCRIFAKCVARKRRWRTVVETRRSFTSLFTTLSNDEIERYSRHLVLSTVGVSGQEALKNSSVLVVGAGGLGSPVLLYLAAAGVGHIGIVDADTVDTSNLQRQIIHGSSTVGVSKCRSAAKRMLDLNPLTNIRTYEEEFTSASAKRIVSEGFDALTPYQVIVDGSDNFPTKYLINDICAIIGIPWIYAAILGFEGQLSTFNYPPGIGADYRDLLPTPPPPGDVPSCAEGGVLGVLPGTLGCLQAVECLKLLLGLTTGLCSGRVLVFDAMLMKFIEVRLVRNADRGPILSLIDYQGFCAGPSTSSNSTRELPSRNKPLLEHIFVNGALGAIRSHDDTTEHGHRTMDEAEASFSKGEPMHHVISPSDCLEKLQSGWSPYVLDVRLDSEHDIVHLPFTDNVVPHREVRANHVPRSGDILIYCKGGVRGRKAIHNLIAQGVAPSRLYNLQGGILQWQKEVDPSMPRY